MKKNYLILSLALTSYLVPLPLILYKLEVGSESLSIAYWIGPGIIISFVMRGTEWFGFLRMLICSLSAAFLVSFLGAMGYVVIPKLVLQDALLKESMVYWSLHYLAMGLVCLLTLWLEEQRSKRIRSSFEDRAKT